MSFAPGVNAIGLKNAEEAAWSNKLAAEQLNAQAQAAKDKRQAEIESEKKMIAANIAYDRQQKINADNMAIYIRSSSPPKFKKGDIVKLKMSGKTKGGFDFSPY